MPSATDSTANGGSAGHDDADQGTIDEESRSVKAPAETDKASEVVKKVKTTSDYFNTLAKDAREPKLIKAIIDENIKAVDGSRVRLRLLDDIEINESVVRRGTYLYATVSGFSSGRKRKHQQHIGGGRTGQGQLVNLRYGRAGRTLRTHQPIPRDKQGRGEQCHVGQHEHEYQRIR